MTIHDALRQISREAGKNFAKEYFKESESFPGSKNYTGAHFESIGHTATPDDQVTATDLLAVQTLSVKVPARAAIGILEASASKVSDLLSRIDPALHLESIESDKDFDVHLGEQSPALELWRLLCRTGPGLKKWGVGPTIASKIMARKRPHLIPIEDSVVNREIGLGSQNSWRVWWEELRQDDYLVERATEVREHVGHSKLSTLRTLDIVLWKSGEQIEASAKNNSA